MRLLCLQKLLDECRMQCLGVAAAKVSRKGSRPVESNRCRATKMLKVWEEEEKEEEEEEDR